MYVGIGILLLLAVLCGVWMLWRRKAAAKKVCCLDREERICRVNQLLEPFGFFYNSCANIVQSSVDAWQREFGYCRAFDRSAMYFHMVFDCEPIYFYYGGRTWLLELWKGQYGINTGAEVGLYHADGIVPQGDLGRTMFASASDSELLPVTMTLHNSGEFLFETWQRHWWLTGFVVGAFCQPKDLSLEVSVTFPHEEMLEAFVEGFRRCGYDTCALKRCGLTVTFLFTQPKSRQYRGLFPWQRCWTQWKNRQFCRLFQWVTRPFSCTAEQILYLYFFLPAACRRMLRFQKSRRQKYSACRKKGRP